MVPAQIQLPDELYARALDFAALRKTSLEEITRRSLEQFLNGNYHSAMVVTTWELPKMDLGEIKVPLDTLHEIVAEEQEMRSLPR